MTTTGTLKLKSKTNKKGNTTKTIEFFFTNAKGQYRSLNFESIHPEQIAEALREKIEATANGTFDVDFEEEGDSVLKLREAGNPWQSASAVAPTQPADTPRAVNPDFFHNPYNFVPALPRDGVEGELGDRKPVGHGRYLPDHWTGRIAVKLTTVTPLLIPDAAKMSVDDKDHKTFPVRIGVDGKPYLPPTSIKGMLRSAYEAVTNSRLSVFESHDARLAYRLPAQDGANVKPARVEKQGNRLYLRVLTSAKLPRYDKNGQSPDKGERHSALKYRGNELPMHGDCVAVKVNGKNKVTEIEKCGPEDSPRGDRKLGWVCVTGANIEKKQSERVFIQSDHDSLILINEEVTELWKSLIKDYQEVHKKDLEERERQKQPPNSYLGHEPGKTAWSRHIYDKDQLALKEGILCYVALKKDRDANGEIDPSDVVALQPVTISRRLYDQKPVDLLPEALRPATDKNALSPADRVFGWVNQKVNQKGKGSYKGHLRIHSVTCLTEPKAALRPFDTPGIPLAILGQPKPAQTRFYAADDKQGSPIQEQEDREYGYQHKERGLRGRKVYPHHHGLPENYWQNPQENLTGQEIDGHYQIYRRSSGPDERDSQNRSITGWVNPGTSFQFEIDVSNLSTVELGALLWLLKLPEPYHHRLGGGKPLGFGSVRLEADFETADIRTGKDWEIFYRSLHLEEKPSFQYSACIAEYQAAVEAAYKASFSAVPFIAAFDRAAQGFEDGAPIHYPWNPETNGKPDPKGENFKWFTDNEQEGRWSLPSLASGKALPLKPRTAEKSQGTGPASVVLQRAASDVKPQSQKDKPQPPIKRPKA